MDVEELKKLLAEATQGPWAYEPHGDTGEYGVGVCFAEDDEDFEVALSGEVDSSVTVEEVVAVEVTGQANARLIAMAPDLADRVIKLESALEEANKAYRESRS